MTTSPETRQKGPIEFDAWKLRLRKDCELQGKLAAYESLGDYALKLLWEDDIEPSVEGIVGKKQNAQSDSETPE